VTRDDTAVTFRAPATRQVKPVFLHHETVKWVAGKQRRGRKITVQASSGRVAADLTAVLKASGFEIDQ
jgi:hypothetical protein